MNGPLSRCADSLPLVTLSSCRHKPQNLTISTGKPSNCGCSAKHEVALATTASALLTPEGPAASERKERRKTHEDAWLSYITGYKQLKCSLNSVRPRTGRGSLPTHRVEIVVKLLHFRGSAITGSPLALRISKRGLRTVPGSRLTPSAHPRA